MPHHEASTGLSDLGRLQASALWNRLRSSRELADVDAMYTSVVRRATETAELIAPALGEIPPVPECDWCEIHAGEAEGLPWAQVRERYPPRGDPDDPFDRRIAGAETWAEFYVRAGARLRRLPHDHPGRRVVVVSTGESSGPASSRWATSR